MSQQPANVQLTAVLKDNTGVPLMNAQIAFAYRLSGSGSFISAGAATTDGTGTATITLALMAPDAYDFQATFAGSTVYLASNVSITFDTTPSGLPQSQITISLSQPVISGNTGALTASGTLVSGGVPIAGAPVVVSVDGTPAGTTTTDASGSYSVQVSNLSLGSHTIGVSYAGSSTVQASQATSTVIVGTAPGGLNPLLLLVPVAVVAAGAAAFVMRK